MIRAGTSTANLHPEACLESKGSLRPWEVQAHYDHEGWYIIWRYMVERTRSLGHSVIVWRVDCAYLHREHWRYAGSTASASGGGRTHTFDLIRPANALRDAAVYSHPRIVLAGGTPVINGH